MPAPDEAPSKPRKLPLVSERVMEGWSLPDWLPEFIKAPFLDRQRQLMAAELKLQRRFLFEYRTQVRSFEPVLKERGLLIGTAIVDAFKDQHTTEVSYEDAAAQQSANNAQMGGFNKKDVLEMMQTLDPIIAPVLTPFVEGLKTPINDQLEVLQASLVKAFVGTAAVSLVVGYVIGRATASGGRGSKGGGGGK
ncbi:hypothetical protein Ndes2526B_g05326 [Nannochloris sp. 'desiccata']|nr:hypothetical protein KSW81_006320 [Chlorella desiccata (nom. nud.)]KAG7674586.1 hypothetical protein KSW81_000235 [Chlorella desiccata (nom. nud.)]KAH7620073.1 hypothetical protein NADE_008348 [Chlorella desiccata (nom. nud.)]